MLESIHSKEKQQVPVEFDFVLWSHGPDDVIPEVFKEKLAKADVVAIELIGQNEFDKELFNLVAQGKFSKKAIKAEGLHKKNSFLVRQLEALQGTNRLVFFPDLPHDLAQTSMKEMRECREKYEDAEALFLSGKFDEGKASLTGAIRMNNERQARRDTFMKERLETLPELISRYTGQEDLTGEGWIADPDIIEQLKQKTAQGESIKVLMGVGAFHSTLVRSFPDSTVARMRPAYSPFFISGENYLERKLREGETIEDEDAIAWLLGKMFRGKYRWLSRKESELGGLGSQNEELFQAYLFAQMSGKGLLSRATFEKIAGKLSQTAEAINKTIVEMNKVYQEGIEKAYPGKIRFDKEYYEREVKRLNSDALLDYYGTCAQEAGFSDFPRRGTTREDELRGFKNLLQKAQKFYGIKQKEESAG